MRIKNNVNPEFYNWFKEKVTIYGALIQPAVAAKLLNKSQGRISQMMKLNEIKSYKYENIKFVSYQDIMKIATEETYKYMEKELNEELEQIKKQNKIPEEQFQQLKNESLKTVLKNNPLTN